MNKRVLLIANEYTTILQFRKELVASLLSHGFDVGISLPPSSHNNEIESLGCEVFYTSVKRHSINPFNDLKYKRELKKIINFFKPSICLSFTIKPNIYGSLVCKSQRVPIITNITGLGESITKRGLLRFISLFLYKRGLKCATWVFFQNSSNMNFMIERKIVTKDKSSLLPGSGVNLNIHKFEDYPNNRTITFIVIGRMIKSKGIDELLEAIKISKQKHSIKFVLIGNCDDEHKNIINDYSKNNLIEYYPYQNNVHDFIKQSNCIIHPSYHEGMSNVLLETAASGRPILASNIPGCKEIVEDGINGFLFEPKSSKSIVCAIDRFLTLSQSEMKEMGIKSNNKAKNEFDRNIVINNYIDKIYNILKL